MIIVSVLSVYLTLSIVRELQRLGALEAAAKASNKGKWNKDTTKVSFRICTLHKPIILIVHDPSYVRTCMFLL